jgi:rubrerythrin
LFLRAVWKFRQATKKLKAVKRLSEGYCPQCKYDFAGKANPECPECGYKLAPREYEMVESIQPVLRKTRSES